MSDTSNKVYRHRGLAKAAALALIAALSLTGCAGLSGSSPAIEVEETVPGAVGDSAGAQNDEALPSDSFPTEEAADSGIAPDSEEDLFLLEEAQRLLEEQKAWAKRSAAGEDDPSDPQDVELTEGIPGTDYPDPSDILTMSFDEYREVNEHFIGVLSVPALGITYPVTYKEFDNDYYLEHTFEGTESELGGIILDGWNRPDFADSLTILHGHNMRDGSMFGSMRRFLTDPSLAEREPYVYFYTERTVKKFRIYSYFHTTIYDRVYDVPEYYYGDADGLSEEAADVLREGCNNWYDSGIEDLPFRAAHDTAKDMSFLLRPRLLMLSTCYGEAHGIEREPVICVLSAEYVLSPD